MCLLEDNLIFFDISGISVTYLETWAVHLKPLVETYKWIELRELPLWATGESPVKNTTDMLIGNNILKKEEYDAVFNELFSVKTYLKGVPLANGKSVFDIWNECQTPLEERWLKVFSDLRKSSVSYEVFAKLVEYALMVPGK